MKLPKISIIMPVALHEECEKSLEALKKVDYPPEKIEIITVKGNRPCNQRNKAAFESKGDILYFLDNDSIVDPKIFKRTIAYYKDENVAGVGGPAITHKSDTFLQKAFGLMLGSFFATQAMASRYSRVGKARKATEKELILCNMSMRRDVFVEEGGFNEKLYPNEENELMNRVIAKKKYFIYDPRIVIYRSQRETIRKFARQIFNYGWGRTRHFLINPSFFQPLFIMPSLFVLYLISLIFIHQPLYLIPLALYLIWTIGGSVEIAVHGRSPAYFFIGIPLFFLFHISYGLGVMLGFNKKFDPKLKHKVPIIKVIKRKSFGKKW